MSAPRRLPRLEPPAALRRGTGSPPLFGIVQGFLSASLYFALGIVVANALGFTWLVLLAASLFFMLLVLSYMEGASLHQERGGATVIRPASASLRGPASGDLHVITQATNTPPCQNTSPVSCRAVEIQPALWSTASCCSYMRLKKLARSAGTPCAPIGGRPGGAITAAAFLSNFVNGVPWVHIDIAGTAWTQDGTHEKSYNSRGATGFGVRTLVKLLMEDEKQPA